MNDNYNFENVTFASVQSLSSITKGLSTQSNQLLAFDLQYIIYL